MKITFIGADHEVTGSCHVIQACDKNILIDCGMEQGTDDYENQELPMNVPDIDYVLLTHAHIDHSGLLPLLYARGFRGSILQQRQQLIYAVSCSRIRHIFRKRRLNGRTGRLSVPEKNWLSLCIPLMTQKVYLNFLYLAIMMIRLNWHRA